MNYRMEINESLWRATFSGSLTKGDLLELVNKVRALRKDNPIASPNGLVDLRALTDINIDFATLNTIVTEAQSYSLRNEVKMALLVDSPVQFGFARMFQTLLDHRQVDVQIFFEDEEDALDWVSK